MENISTTTHIENVLNYYNDCWLTRFEQGHNPISHAMHMGYFENGISNNDEAKQRMNMFLASQLGLEGNSPKTVVDAGCGIGSSVLYLAENFSNIEIKAINISESQIGLAKSFYAADLTRSSIEFLCTDYCDTSLPDESADVVYALESLCHASKKELFFAEANRILKKGGRLIIIDYTNSGSSDNNNCRALLNEFSEGWAVNEYLVYNEEVIKKTGFTKIDKSSLLQYVKRGIDYSSAKALKKLSDPDNRLTSAFTRHLKACIALKKLVELNGIDYSMIKCFK